MLRNAIKAFFSHKADLQPLPPMAPAEMNAALEAAEATGERMKTWGIRSGSIAFGALMTGCIVIATGGLLGFGIALAVGVTSVGLSGMAICRGRGTIADAQVTQLWAAIAAHNEQVRNQPQSSDVTADTPAAMPAPLTPDFDAAITAGTEGKISVRAPLRLTRKATP